MASLVSSPKHVKKQYQSYMNCSREEKVREHFPIILWGQHDTDISTWQERHMKGKLAISVFNVDAILLNKTSANQTQGYIKSIIPYNQVEFISGMQERCDIRKESIYLSH